MPERTALDLQTEARLDLAEVALSCEVAGLQAAASARGLLVGIPDRRKRCRWRGTAEHGWLTVILQREVRKVAPGSFVMPTLSGHALFVHDHSARWLPAVLDVVATWGGIKGATETECWARALVALHRAGLLAKVGT